MEGCIEPQHFKELLQRRDDLLYAGELFLVVVERVAGLLEDICRGFGDEAFVGEFLFVGVDRFDEPVAFFALAGDFGIAVNQAFQWNEAVGVAEVEAGGTDGGFDFSSGGGE